MKSPAPKSSFASDNASGVHPRVMEALGSANAGHVLAYGDDRYTRESDDAFRMLFDRPVEVRYCWGGTGANVVGLQSLLRSYQAVICTTAAHVNVDECGAAEWILGTKLLDVDADDAKLTPEMIEAKLWMLGDEHHVQPSVVSITQSTEHGTLYSLEEIAALVEVTHRHGMRFHLDGARIANACVALGIGGSDLAEVGIDVMTFGGTKNGAMYGEAVVYLDPTLAADSRFLRKQNAQLPSKMRFIAAQFSALLDEDLWLRNASHANAMAARLAAAVEDIEGVTITDKPAVNAVFATLSRPAIERLQEWSFFYDWDVARDQVRWMCSFDTTPDDVDRFVEGISEAVC